MSYTQKYFTLITAKDERPNFKPKGVLHISSVDQNRQVFDENGQLLGILAKEDESLLPTSSSVDGMKDEEILGNLFVMRRHNTSTHYFSLVDLFPANDPVAVMEKQTKKNTEQKKNDDSNACLIVGGTQTVCHGKRDMLKHLEDGKTYPCTLQVEDGTVVVYDQMGRVAGKMVPGQQIPKVFAQKIEVNAIACIPSDFEEWENRKNLKTGTNPYVVMIQEKKELPAQNFEDTVNRLNEACLDHPENVYEKIHYLRSAGVPDDHIQAILDSYMMYSGDDRTKIKKPAFPFMDGKEEYLDRAITCMLTGCNIRFVGDKGCGKNTLLDSLSWVFNQPLFKIGCSERTDEYTILGSTQLVNGDTIHKLSPFAHGLAIGGICILDEGNMVPPELLSVVNQLTDDTREVDIANYGLLKLHDRTRVCLTMNEDYDGTSGLNDATADRFDGIFMESSMNIRNLLAFLVPDAKASDLDVCSKVYDRIAKAVKTQNTDQQLSDQAITIRGYKNALKKAKYRPIGSCLVDSLCGRNQDPTERQIIMSSIRMYTTYIPKSGK